MTVTLNISLLRTVSFWGEVFLGHFCDRKSERDGGEMTAQQFFFRFFKIKFIYECTTRLNASDNMLKLKCFVPTGPQDVKKQTLNI